MLVRQSTDAYSVEQTHTDRRTSVHYQDFPPECYATWTPRFQPNSPVDSYTLGPPLRIPSIAAARLAPPSSRRHSASSKKSSAAGPLFLNSWFLQQELADVSPIQPANWSVRTRLKSVLRIPQTSILSSSCILHSYKKNGVRVSNTAWEWVCQNSNWRASTNSSKSYPPRGFLNVLNSKNSYVARASVRQNSSWRTSNEFLRLLSQGLQKEDPQWNPQLLPLFSLFLSFLVQTTRNGVRVSNKACESVRPNSSWRASYKFFRILPCFFFLLKFSIQEKGAGSLWTGASKSISWRTSYVNNSTSCSPPLFLASRFTKQIWRTCAAHELVRQNGRWRGVLVEILNRLLLLSTACVQILIQTQQIGWNLAQNLTQVIKARQNSSWRAAVPWRARHMLAEGGKGDGEFVDGWVQDAME